MKKSTKYVDTYTPNKQVLVTVTHKPNFQDEEFVDFARTVTIKIRAGNHKDKLEFKEEDAIAKFVENVDFEDPQTNLFDGASKPEKTRKGK